ncbi:hypothetical protein APA22_17770 [Acetobacter pasteurianus IFO 3283-22]|uniref:Uncharacterized protein n=1 Tax=Acetobacter pasteurianus (strain NBRC 105184 / IFO 3283-01) TaxID=634452 RepID=C7JC75_ACEP3|nr:hypothetical protein APA01_17770 [Acetobacter pasteurianus IFO 3283-01]BAI02956.1 hypothetical protein APA03_17770 [Acetobacter pasteurianus IFO 3283-03]BAI06002.1 hypothetical protein APA07_17770 [Acetobacter pasteurianus IFO 3283-07]BAI09051.1 hypothetical protein APA22_17770 [Acetobacter pasteurianus IFO 3283-22]BAI12099.1 hypothetical protein APA26_17770 [Acetobacter pasteurianus IFO 3283-26]BAI15145.1 hypothetical protein APA32_17770 [Acetobacter pasteurianus IFO 3283-32]BAI18125.1 hy
MTTSYQTGFTKETPSLYFCNKAIWRYSYFFCHISCLLYDM